MELLQKLISTYEKYSWFWFVISKNPLIIQYLETTNNRPKVDWGYLSSKLSWDYISRNDDIPWNWYMVSTNPNVTWDIIQSNPTKRWSYQYLSENPNITPEIVCKNADKGWEYIHLAVNPNFTLKDLPNDEKVLREFYMTNPNALKEPFNSYLSYNKHVTSKYVLKNFDKLWDWYILSRNPNMTWEVVSKVLDYHLCWSFLSENPNITPEIYENNKNLPWERLHLLMNPNFHFDLEELQESDLFFYFKNPNLNFYTIPSKYVFKYGCTIVSNHFTHDKNLRISKKNLIWKNYCLYKLRRNLHIIANKYRVNGEILYKPNLGIKFYETMNDLKLMFD